MIHCATTSQSYFDIGFGLERLASVFHDGDAGKLDPLTPILQQWLSARLAPGEISSLTHYFQAVFLLKEEGINAGNKAAHYVLRKLIRRIVEVVFPVSLIGARSEMATLLEELARAYESHLSAQVRAAIQQEFDREIVRIAKGLELGKSRARRFLCRRRWSSGEDLGHRLQDTFGLPPTVVDELLAEWQKHACE